MSRIRILCLHPVSNPTGPSLWDGKVYKYDGDVLDVQGLGKWLTAKTGIRFDYGPGRSRVEDGCCVFFPRKYNPFVYCMYVAAYTEPPSCRLWTSGAVAVERGGNLQLQAAEHGSLYLKDAEGLECFAEIRYQIGPPSDPLDWRTVYRKAGLLDLQMRPVGRGRKMTGDELVVMYRQASGDVGIVADVY